MTTTTLGAVLSNDETPDAAKRRTGERFRVLNAFVDSTMRGLSPSEIAVWLVLYRDTKPDGLAQTAQVSLARRAGIDERSVRRAVEKLKLRGLVTLVHRGSKRGGASKYRVRSVPQ